MNDLWEVSFDEATEFCESALRNMGFESMSADDVYDIAGALEWFLKVRMERLERVNAELVKALESLLDLFIRVRLRGGFEPSTIEGWREVIATRAALAKAKGEA